MNFNNLDMKNLKLMLVLATVTMTAVSCGPKKGTQNVEAKDK